MRRHSVRLKPQARLDLIEAALYIAQGNPRAADRFLDGMTNTLELIARNPMLGREREELAATLRSLPHRSHVIFYRPLEAGIEVVRVLHSARYIASLFKEFTLAGAAA
jgi:toxin ParE1/3/4